MLRRSLLTTLCVAAFAHGLAWVNGSSARALKNHHEHHLRHEWKPGESEASFSESSLTSSTSRS